MSEINANVAVQVFMDDFENETSGKSKAEREAGAPARGNGSGGSSSGGGIMGLAIAMGKAADEMMEEVQTMADGLSDDPDISDTTELQGKTQVMKAVTEAGATAVKTVGEGQSSNVRKQ